MALTHQDVVRIAKLARIAVSDDEIVSIGEELNPILGLIETMQAVNTDDVEPMTHPQDLILRARPDEVTESNQRETFLALAPQVEAGLFLVPKVID